MTRFRNTELPERLKRTAYFVQASSYENQCIWEKYLQNKGEQLSLGFDRTIGHLGGRPIVVELSWHVINGHPICFYDVCSEVADWKQVDKWFKQHAPNYELNNTNATNFQHCMHAVERLPVIAVWGSGNLDIQL